MGYELTKFQINGNSLELYVAPGRLFDPNATSRRYAKGAGSVEDKVVFDIGTGVGVLAIWAAVNNASAVYGVDVVKEHIDLARMNLSIYPTVGDRTRFFCGDIFEPLNGYKADLIIGDVSGIAEDLGRAVGWYPPNVPTGGEDGTMHIVRLLEQASKYLNPGGEAIFGVAIGCSDHQKVLSTAEKSFPRVEKVTESFMPYTPEQVQAIRRAYNDELPSFIEFIPKGSRLGWRGEIYRASQ